MPEAKGFYRDLRGHIEALRERDLLVQISRPINKDTELHPLVRLQFRGLPEVKRRAFLFDNVTDVTGRKYQIPVLVGGLAASEEIYGIGLQCAPAEIVERWHRALSKPLEPVLVETGKVKEVIHRGKGLLEHGGLEEFPVPISTPGFDNAPYFTAACWITKDPETGTRNMGMYRAQIKGPLRTGLYIGDNNNTAMNWGKANSRGKPLEAAAVIGGPVSVAYAAIQTVPYGVDEIAIAGALVDAPIPLVKAETVDLEVPADAEIVVEGLIHTELLEPEGSFGESHGYSDPRTLSPFFEITAITHRRDPIWVSIISQLTPSESSKTKQRAHETSALRLLRDHHSLKGVQRVVLFEPLLNRQYAVISMRRVSEMEPWDAIYALLATRARPKIIVAVDEDIDPEDPMAVNWAIVNRCQPHRDMRIVHPRPLPHGPLRFVADGNRYDTSDSALLINATAKAALPPISLPARQHMERALEIWKELELPALELKAPWYGYSLGLWSSESREEAELALQGRYFETGKKLAARGEPTPPGSRIEEVRRKFRHEGTEKK
ncbi:MAG: UbiD family decarboxylase [Deltaproteobacteria bacterium]|nr:UbiD family decarboxylase [Deltaproteobacteria bacterium]